MIVKRNSAEFKEIRDFIEEYSTSRDRRKKIRLYSIKPLQSLDKSILLGSRISELVYDLEIDTLKFNMLDAKHKLFRDEKTGIYYFKSSGRSLYIELPFEIRD